MSRAKYFHVFQIKMTLLVEQWRLGSVLEHCEVPKYYDQDCSSVSQYFLKNNVKEFRVLAALNREPSVGLQNPMFRTCYST